MSILKLHSEPVQDEWLDGYGHLNEAYYLVPFSKATWAAQEHFGVGLNYFEETGCAVYSVETHLQYLKEVRAPARMDIETMIFGSDAKRICFAHRMLVEGIERATFECMTLHFDTKSNRTAAMPEGIQTKFKQMQVETLPDWAGRRISF